MPAHAMQNQATGQKEVKVIQWCKLIKKKELLQKLFDWVILFNNKNHFILFAVPSLFAKIIEAHWNSQRSMV